MSQNYRIPSIQSAPATSLKNAFSSLLAASLAGLKRFCVVGVTLAVLLVMLASCTNSRLVLRPLYNSLDDQIQDQMLSYGEFTDAQTKSISELIDHFHVWHRQSQLPHYAALANNFADTLSTSKKVSMESVQSWSQSLTRHASTLGRCTPVYLADSVLSTLDDEQIATIIQNRAETRESRRRERELQLEGGLGEGGAASADATSVSGSDRAARRAVRQESAAKRVRRYIELAGLKISAAQFNDYKATLASQRYPDTPFREILDEWDERFFELLKTRNEPGWAGRLHDYVDRRRQAFSDRRREERAYNVKLWEDFALRTINGLDDEQHEFVVNWLSKLAVTLTSLSKDKPSYTAAGAMDFRCEGAELSL